MSIEINSNFDSKNESELNSEIGCNDFEDSSKISETSEPKKKRPNKTERKYEKYQRKLANYKLKKLEKKKLKNEQKSQNMNETEAKEFKKEYCPDQNQLDQDHENFLNKRELKKRTIERLNQVYKDPSSSLKICIDCSFSDKMSNKEMSRLAQQIGRCYATNRSISSPVHLTLCNLDKQSKFYQELCRVNDGFSRYIIETSEKTLEQNYSDKMSTIAYLSPDSDIYLENLDTDKTYVIGGLVDETVNKKVTLTKCEDLKIKTYSLPIEKYMTRKISNELEAKVYNYNKILAINQVFDILANYFINKDWPTALECGVPKRKGFYTDNKEENLKKENTD